MPSQTAPPIIEMAWMIAILISDDEDFSRYYGLQKQFGGKVVGDQKLQPNPWECDMFNGGFMKKQTSEKGLDPWDS